MNTFLCLLILKFQLDKIEYIDKKEEPNVGALNSPEFFILIQRNWRSLNRVLLVSLTIYT